MDVPHNVHLHVYLTIDVFVCVAQHNLHSKEWFQSGAAAAADAPLELIAPSPPSHIHPALLPFPCLFLTLLHEISYKFCNR